MSSAPSGGTSVILDNLTALNQAPRLTGAKGGGTTASAERQQPSIVLKSAFASLSGGCQMSATVRCLSGRLAQAAMAFGAACLLSFGLATGAHATTELRVITFEGYAEPAWLEP